MGDRAIAIRFDDVRRTLRGNRALAGFSGRVPEGSVTALLGRNGAGKTTALRCAVDLLRPDSGSIEVLGHPSRGLPPEVKARVGYVSESSSLDPRVRVSELLDLGRALYPTWDEALARDLLDRLALDRQRSIADLSLGENRKLALLFNLAFRPRLLILDEPAANLDAIVRREFLEALLAMFRAEGLSVLFSTHQLQDVERVADRILLIDEGRLRVESDLDELKDGVKLVRLTRRGGVDDVAVPGLLTRRRIGDALDLTVEGFDASLPLRLSEQTGAEVAVTDLPLEEIFIAYGSSERASSVAAS